MHVLTKPGAPTCVRLEEVLEDLGGPLAGVHYDSEGWKGDMSLAVRQSKTFEQPRYTRANEQLWFELAERIVSLCG
jgi:hypothetical protein